MKKETLAQKIARRSFESPAIRKSWAVHKGAFGPLLEESFSGNYQAKIHLCAALNHIARREGDAGRKKLRELQKHLETPMDHAAYHFFLGLSHEAEGNASEALEGYRACCANDPAFFMPWVKLAKLTQDAKEFPLSEESWRKAIALAPHESIAAVYQTNLCGCLTRMGKLEEAYTALMESRRLAPTQKGRDAVAAVYYAAAGDRENAENCLRWVREDTPQLYPGTKEVVETLLSGGTPD